MSLDAVIKAAPYILKTGSSISSFVGASGANQAGAEAAAAYEAQAQVEARALRLQAARRRGVLRAGVAASGVDPNRGTPAQVAMENAYLDELDAQMALWNGTQKAQRARLDGQTLATGAAGEGVTTLVESATRWLKGLGASPAPLAQQGAPGVSWHGGGTGASWHSGAIQVP